MTNFILILTRKILINTKLRLRNIHSIKNYKNFEFLFAIKGENNFATFI